MFCPLKLIRRVSGASPAGGQGGNASPIYFLSPAVFIGKEKVAGFGRKKRLNLWLRPEEAFGFRRRTFFFGDHLKLRLNPIQE